MQYRQSLYKTVRFFAVQKDHNTFYSFVEDKFRMFNIHHQFYRAKHNCNSTYIYGNYIKSVLITK